MPIGAAEVAHHVEQSAGVRDLLGRQRLQREPRRRQQAEHRREAAHHLRPEHLVEVGARLSNALQPSPIPNRLNPNADRQRAIHPALQRAGDRRGHQLRDAGDQHDRADLQRAVRLT